MYRSISRLVIKFHGRLRCAHMCSQNKSSIRDPYYLAYVLIALMSAGSLKAANLYEGTPAASLYDTVILGGMIIDGSGEAGYRADVGIREGKIVRIGQIGRGRAIREVVAEGKVVAPGFIDLHTHSEDALLFDGTAQSMVRQGVTLNVLGEGSSVAPLQGDQILEVAEALKSRYALELDWRTFAEYFERIQRQGVSINVAATVGLQQVKTAVIGHSDRPATREELEEMKEYVVEAMRDGAVGVSSAWQSGGYDYANEVVEMAAVAAKYGGYYSTHVGSEGYEIEEEVRKAIYIARKVKIPVHILHFKIRGRNLWGKLDPVISLIERAREEGLWITANQYPYTAMQHPWGGLFPQWARTPPDKIFDILGDPEKREDLKMDPRFQQYVEEHGGFENIVASRFSEAELKPFEGKTIAEIARGRGDEDPADTCFDLILEEGNFVPGIYHNMSESNVRRIMKLPWVTIASDGLALRPDGVLGEGIAHPRSYGTFPRVLGKYVREEAALTLEEAVRKLSGLPAEIAGLKDRGYLAEGNWADLVVFDPRTVIDRGTFDVPEQYPIGIEYVFVNGITVVDRGEHTGRKPGKVVFNESYHQRAVKAPAT